MSHVQFIILLRVWYFHGSGHAVELGVFSALAAAYSLHVWPGQVLTFAIQAAKPFKILMHFPRIVRLGRRTAS